MNFIKGGPISLYNDKGEVQFAHTREKETELKKQGFKWPKSPVVQNWPKDVYHTSGRSRQIGKHGQTDEQNMTDFKALGEGWSFEPPPEKLPQVAGPQAASVQAAPSDAGVKALTSEVKLVTTRVEALELSGEQQAETIMALREIVDGLQTRLAKLEALIGVEDAAPAPEPAAAGSKKK